jgi:serine/threonine protein kinase
MVFYGSEVIKSIEYLHSCNILYRDLKPENIILSMKERGHIRIVDFGFSKILKNSKLRTTTNCGTPAYIAPEILREGVGHSFEVDIWSFGVLLFEMASG